jgi:hypothetical protein
MTTKKVYYYYFRPVFSKKFSGSQTFFEKLSLSLEKYQHLYKALLAQSLLFVGFYHWFKYLHNLESHPVGTYIHVYVY